MEQQDALVVIKQSDLTRLYDLIDGFTGESINPNIKVDRSDITTFLASEVFEAAKTWIAEATGEEFKAKELKPFVEDISEKYETYTDYEKTKI